MLPALSRFAVDERVGRFEQNLWAWETLVSQDPARLRREFESGWMIEGFGRIRIPSADEALTEALREGVPDALHEGVPDAFHEDAERRILALRQKVDAARSA